jgi:hypothetical protein
MPRPGERLRLVQGQGGRLLPDHLACADRALAAGGAEARHAFQAMMDTEKIDVAAIETARRG